MSIVYPEDDDYCDEEFWNDEEDLYYDDEDELFWEDEEYWLDENNF